MSVEFESENGEHTSKNLFATSNNIKTVRFMLGPTTVALSVTQDTNNTSSALNVHIGQTMNSLNMVLGSNTPLAPGPETPARTASKRSSSKTEEESEKEFIKNMSGWLMTVATLLMSMAFSVGLHIPGGTWSATKIKSSSQPNTQTSTPLFITNYQFLTGTSRVSNTNLSSTTDVIYICRDIASSDDPDPNHNAGQPIIMNKDQIRYYVILALNSGAFGTATLIVWLLIFKKSPKQRLVGIRYLLVYAMLMIAGVFVFGGAASLEYVSYLAAALITCAVFALLLMWLVRLVIHGFIRLIHFARSLRSGPQQCPVNGDLEMQVGT